jgi:hypothetical protein
LFFPFAFQAGLIAGPPNITGARPIDAQASNELSAISRDANVIRAGCKPHALAAASALLGPTSLLAISTQPILRQQFKRRAAAKHSGRRAGVPRPVAQLGQHRHRMLNRDIAAGQFGTRRTGVEMSGPHDLKSSRFLPLGKTLETLVN